MQMDGTVRVSASKAKFRESDRPDTVHGLNCKRAARFVLLRDDRCLEGVDVIPSNPIVSSRLPFPYFPHSACCGRPTV